MEPINQDMRFEDALKALAEVVDELESGDLTLEKSLALYERGQALTAYCSEQLQAAKIRVEQLSAEGEIVELS